MLPQRDGRVDLDALLDELGRRKVTSLLVEGGAAVHGAFFDAGLPDEALAFLAPLIVGGGGGARAGRRAGSGPAGRGAPAAARRGAPGRG